MNNNIFRNGDTNQQYPQIIPQGQQLFDNQNAINAFNSFNLEHAKIANNQLLRNARNLEELVGIKVHKVDGLLAGQQQNYAGRNNSSITTPNQNQTYDPRFDPLHYSQKVPCMGNRQFLINQAILSSSKPSQKVYLGGKARDVKRVITASTAGTIATRFQEFQANKLQSVGSTNSFKKFQESCGQNPISKKTQSQSYAPLTRNQNSQNQTGYLENIGQESNQGNINNVQSDDQSQIQDQNSQKKEEKGIQLKELDPIKALKTIFHQKSKKRRVPLDSNQIANKYKKKMQEQEMEEKKNLHTRGVTAVSDQHQLGSYFDSYLQAKIFTPQSNYSQQTQQPSKVYKEDQLYQIQEENNKAKQNFDSNIFIQQNLQSAQYQQQVFQPEMNDLLIQQQLENNKVYSQQSQRHTLKNESIKKAQNIDVKQRLENLRKLFEEDDINNAVQEIQNEWQLEELKTQYTLENSNIVMQEQNNEGQKQLNIISQKNKGKKNKKSPTGILQPEDQDFPINDLRRYLTDKIKNVQKRSNPIDILQNNNRVPLELPKELEIPLSDDQQDPDAQKNLKFQFKASTLTHIAQIKQIGQEKIENQFIERIFREQTGYEFEKFQLKQLKEFSKQAIFDKRRNQKKFQSDQQKDGWKSKKELQIVEFDHNRFKQHQMLGNMHQDLYIIEKQQSSDDTRQSQRLKKKKQRQNVVQEQMMRIDRINRGIPEPQKNQNQDFDYSKYVPTNVQQFIQNDLAAGSSYTQQVHNEIGTGSIQTNYTENQGVNQMFQNYPDSGTGYVISAGIETRPTPMTQILKHNINNEEDSYNQNVSKQSPLMRQQDQSNQNFSIQNIKDGPGISPNKNKNEVNFNLIQEQIQIITPQNYMFQQQNIISGKNMIIGQQQNQLTKSLVDDQLTRGQETFPQESLEKSKNNSQKFLHTQQILMNLPQNNIFQGSKQNGVNDFRVSQIVQDYNNKQKVKETLNAQISENEEEDQGFPNYLSDTELFMRTRNQFIKREKTAESRGGGFRQRGKNEGKKEKLISPVNDKFRLLQNQKQMLFQQRLEQIQNARINQQFIRNQGDFQLNQFDQQQEIVHGSHFQYFCPKRFNRYPRFTIFFKKDQVQGKDDRHNQYVMENTVSLSPQFLSYLMDKSSVIQGNPAEAITTSLKQNQYENYKLKVNMKQPNMNQVSPKQNEQRNGSIEERENKQRSTLSSDVSPIRLGVQDNLAQQELQNQNKILVGGDDAIQSWNLYNENMQSYDPFQKVILVKGIDNSILTSFRTLKRENNTVSDTFKIVHKKFQPNKNIGFMRMIQKGQANKMIGGILNFNNNKYQLPEYPFTDNEYAMEIGQAQLLAESFLQHPEDSILNAPKDGNIQQVKKQISTSNVSKSPHYQDANGNQMESDNSVIQQISGYDKLRHSKADKNQQIVQESKIIHGGITGISQQSSIGLGVSNIPAAYELSQFDQRNNINVEEVISKISPKIQQNKKQNQMNDESQYLKIKQQRKLSPLRQSVDNEFKVSQRTNTGMLRGAIYSQNIQQIQQKNGIDFQNIEEMQANNQSQLDSLNQNKKYFSQVRRDNQNNKHQIEVMVLSKVDPFDFAFPALQAGSNESALASSNYNQQNLYVQNNHNNQYAKIQDSQKQQHGMLSISSPQAIKFSQNSKRNPFNQLVKGSFNFGQSNINKNQKYSKNEKQSINIIIQNDNRAKLKGNQERTEQNLLNSNEYFKNLKQSTADGQRVQTVNKQIEQEQKSSIGDQNSNNNQDKQRFTQELLESVEQKQETNEKQNVNSIDKSRQVSTNIRQNKKNKDISRHQAIYKLASYRNETPSNQENEKNLKVVIEQNRPKSRTFKNFKQQKMSNNGIDQQKIEQKYGKDFKIPELPQLLQTQLNQYQAQQTPSGQNQGIIQNNQQYKIKKFIDEIYQKEAKNRYHKQYVREDYLSPHCPIFNLEKFHQLKPKDEMMNLGYKNKYGGINKEALEGGMIYLDKNGNPIIYRGSQSLSNVLGFQAGGPNVQPSQILKMDENQQNQVLLNQQSGLPALFGNQISYRQNNQTNSASDNISNQVHLNTHKRQSLNLQNQTSGDTIGRQASLKDQSKIIGTKQLKIPQSNFIIQGQQSQNQIQQTDENQNLKATFDGRVEATSEVDHQELAIRQSGLLYESYVNPKLSTNKIQTGAHDIENNLFQS